MPFICPLCQHPLQRKDNIYLCSSKTSQKSSKQHLFDIAREGYVNLMPVHHKSSKVPGDNLNMIQARRAFLTSEQYHPMRKRVAELLKKTDKSGGQNNYSFKQKSQASSLEKKILLDIGCGEGYYTGYLAESLPYYQVYGIDISKVAKYPV